MRMMPNPPAATVRVDLGRIRRNAIEIARKTGVPVIAVVKADAYGLGATSVASAIGDLVDGFYVFDAAEAVQYELHARTGKRSIALMGESNDARDYLSHHIQPAVWTKERAMLLQKARPLLSIDAGQGRFGCDESNVRDILDTRFIEEAFTHAANAKQLATFQRLERDLLAPYRPALRLHAASTALAGDPSARYDAVRIGIGLYIGAARVSAHLIEVHDGDIERGYSGFRTPRCGVIRRGYSNGLKPGPCLVNGTRRNILEVGMQTAFVELGPADRLGDEVILLGEGIGESQIASAWGCSPQEVLIRLSGAGVREYVQDS